MSGATHSGTLTRKERTSYLVGLLGQNMIYNIIGSCLMYYLQFTLLIPALTVTAIFTAARIFDACNDPIMGTVVDRTRSKYGKCVPYLRIMPIPIMIITILCYVTFGFYGEGSKALDAGIVIWTAFTYILWGVLYTVADIPLWGVTSLMTEDEKERNKLLSAARIVAAIGGGAVMLSMQSLALGVGGFLSEKLGISAMEGEQQGFLLVASVFSVISTALFMFVGFGIKEHVSVPPKKTSLKENLSIIAHNKPYMQLLISGVLGSTKTLIAIVAMTVVTYYFASKDALMAVVYMILLGGGYFVGNFVFMGMTNSLNKKFSKKVLYNFSNIITIVPYVMIYVTYKIDPHHLTNWWWLVACFLLFAVAGGGGGITTVLQSQMIADCVNYEEYKSGRRPDGLFFSGQTFLVKLQSGLATIASGIAYSAVHFSDIRVDEVNAFVSAGGIPRLAPEYDSFMGILFLIISLPPAVGCLLSVIPTWKYALDDKEHERILGVLVDRRMRGVTVNLLGEEIPLELDTVVSQQAAAATEGDASDAENVPIDDGVTCNIPEDAE